MSSEGDNYALKFISGKYQGGQYPLRAGREIVIGRSSELDMVLVEDMVSRKHAKVSVQQGAVTIQDLGSTNGTFVNGEKIKKARLHVGDRILIGTSILKLVTQDPSSAESTDEQIRAEMERVSKKAEAEPGVAIGMQGRLEDVPMPDLLQLFATSKKNGVLTLREGADVGKVYLREGLVYFCSINDQHAPHPRKIFYRLLRWSRGAFELGPPSDEKVPIELYDPTQVLLMEGMRHLDEMKRIEAELPLRSHLRLAIPLRPQLKDLQPAELDVLQGAVNLGVVQAVIDAVGESELETATTLQRLVQNQYLTVG